MPWQRTCNALGGQGLHGSIGDCLALHAWDGVSTFPPPPTLFSVSTRTVTAAACQRRRSGCPLWRPLPRSMVLSFPPAPADLQASLQASECWLAYLQRAAQQVRAMLKNLPRPHASTHAGLPEQPSPGHAPRPNMARCMHWSWRRPRPRRCRRCVSVARRRRCWPLCSSSSRCAGGSTHNGTGTDMQDCALRPQWLGLDNNSWPLRSAQRNFNASGAALDA